MHPYVIALIVSAMLSASFAGALLSFRSRQREGIAAAALLGCGALWSLLQALWCSTDDPETALLLVRLASIGWLPIPALALHLVAKSVPKVRTGIRRMIPWTYAVTGALLLLDWLTPFVHRQVHPTSWGWAYELDVGFLLIHAWLIVVSTPVIWLALRDFRASPSPAERRQSSVLGAGLLVPLLIGSLTDGVLPLLGLSFPYLGGMSITFLGMIGAASIWRYGYSVLVPTAYAFEILDTLPEGVAMTQLDGRIRSANLGLAELTGRLRDSLEGLFIHDLVNVSLELLRQGLRDRECELAQKKGSRVPVIVGAEPLRDSRGLEIGLVVVVHDQREIVSLRSTLLLSGRLAAVGELAAGVAHEINNPLAYVRANLGTLSSHMKELDVFVSADPTRGGDSLGAQRKREAQDLVEEGHELLVETLEGVDRAVSIVRDIKGFSHAGSGDHETVDLHELMESVLRVAGPQLGRGLSLERDYRALPMLECAPQELKQVFLNIVLNASHATERQGRIRIETEDDGDLVVVRMIDDGVGILPAVRERIFDPFFTTKPVGEGTGLGLAISYEIVRRHRGEIDVHCPPEGGTCVEVRIPRQGADTTALP